MLKYCDEEGDYQLLVEGSTDCHATIAIWNNSFKAPKFSIKVCNSDESVLMKLNALINSPDRPKVVGVILDADDELANRRLQQIKGKVKKYGYNFPSQLDNKGTIIASVKHYPKLGIWIMPNNKDKGLIEDFYINLAPTDTINYIEDVVDEALDKDYADFKKPHRSKAIIHTFLSWQNEPGYPLGVSIKALKFDTTKSEAVIFLEWLNKLFERK